MRRSLILGVMAFVVSSLFGVEPVASWSGFSTTTSGSYTATIPDGAKVDTDTGVVTLGSTPLSVDIAGVGETYYVTLLAQVESVPTDTTSRVLEVKDSAGNRLLAVSGSSSSTQTLKAGWSQSDSGISASTGTQTWTSTDKHWVALAYGSKAPKGTIVYLDDATVATAGNYVFSDKTISTIYVGRSASGMKVHQLYIYTSKLAQADVVSEIIRVSPNRSATLSTGETAWENISWDKELAPVSGDNITFTLSGDTTLTGVPDTTYATVTIAGSGTLKLSGTTLNTAAFTVGDEITALDTSALTIASSASLTIPNTCTWTMGSQTFSSLSLLPATKTLVIKGETSFNGDGAAQGFAYGRNITVSGSSAVFSTTKKDSTGWDYTSGQSLTATDGGKISFGSRETFKTPLTLCGGTLETTDEESGRAIDFYYQTSGNGVTVNASSSATDTNPTISYFTASGSSDDDKKFYIREGALPISIAKNAQLVVDALFYNTAAACVLTKQGEGTMVLKRASAINYGSVNVTAGTLKLDGDGVVTGSAALAVSSGATVEFAGGTGTIAPSQIISGAGTLKLTSGTVNLTGITEGSTAFPTVAFADASTATLLIGTGSAFCSQTSITVPDSASIHLVLTDEQLRSSYTLPEALKAVKARITFYKDATTAVTDEDGTYNEETGTFTATPNTWTVGESSETSFAWTDTSHWSRNAVPAKGDLFILTASDDSAITITGVPETTFGTMTVKGSGTLTLEGTTLNVTSASVESGVTLNTEALAVATASVAVAAGGTWVSGNATLTGGSVTGTGAFTVNSGSVSLTTLPDSTLSAITVNKDASLTLASTNQGTFSLPNLTGTGTVIFGMTGTSEVKHWENTFTFSSGFKGTTKVTAGQFTLESSTLGSKLILSGGAWQVISPEVKIAADIVYESSNETECHVNSGNSATFTGTVTGTKFKKSGGGTLTFAGAVELDTLNFSAGTLVIKDTAKTLSIKDVTNISNAVTVPSGVVFKVGKLNRAGVVTFASGSTLKPYPDYTTPTLVAGAKSIVLEAGSTLDLTEGKFTVNGTDTLGLPDTGTVKVKVAGAGQLLATTTLSTSDAEKFTLDTTDTTLIPAVNSTGLYAVVVPADGGDTSTDTATKEAIAKAAAKAAATAGVSTVTEVTAAEGCYVAGAALFDGVITVTPDSTGATTGKVTVEYAFGISKMTLTKSDDQPQVTVYAQIRGKDDSIATITSSSEIVLQTKAIGAEDKEFTDVSGDYTFAYDSDSGTYTATVTGVNISNVVFRVLARTKSTTN